MSIFDAFKKKISFPKPVKKDREERKKKKKEEEKAVKKIKEEPKEKEKREKETEEEKKDTQAKTPEKKKKRTVIFYTDILASPYFTEKTDFLSKENKYVFKIKRGSNKQQIKSAVEQSYNVDVSGVKIINVKRKRTRLGKHKGWKKGFKKAIVELKKGQKIELLSK